MPCRGHSWGAQCLLGFCSIGLSDFGNVSLPLWASVSPGHQFHSELIMLTDIKDLSFCVGYFFFFKFPIKELRSLIRQTCIVNSFLAYLHREVVGGEQRKPCRSSVVNKHLNLGEPPDVRNSGKTFLACKVSETPKCVACISLRFPLNAALNSRQETSHI